jgi:zinc protease
MTITIAVKSLLVFISTAIFAFSTPPCCEQGQFLAAPPSPSNPVTANRRQPSGNAGYPEQSPDALAEPLLLRHIRIPPLHDFNPQQPKRIQLNNGLVIFLQEDFELPLVKGTVTIHGGSVSEEPNKLGLVNLYGETWRIGGTSSKSGDEIDSILETRAAKIETTSDIDSTELSFSCLKEDFDLVLGLTVDLLRNPVFREDKLELTRLQVETDVAKRNEDAREISIREALKLVYGPMNPYARTPESATVQAVTRQDLIDWHENHVFPNNVVIGIVGDFDAQIVEDKLRRFFESWARGPEAATMRISFQKANAGVYYIERKNATQSQIRIVAQGTRRDNPDFYALQVMNEVFESRLFNNVRTKKALAYSVSGEFGSAYDHPGVFSISTATKSRTTVSAIEACLREVDNLVGVAPTTRELQNGKDNVLNSFIFAYDSRTKILRDRMSLEFYGYPVDFVERYKVAVEKVTIADVTRVANKYVDKRNLAILVVGDQLKFEHNLSTLGPVTNLNVSIPESPAVEE